MILRYAHLSRHPAVFQAMTGLTVAAFDALVADLLPACVTAKQQRLTRPNRRRAIGGGHHAEVLKQPTQDGQTRHDHCRFWVLPNDYLMLRVMAELPLSSFRKPCFQ